MICRSCRIAICLIVATTLSILATLPIVYAQSNDPVNINKYYSDDVHADSVVFTCTIHLPEDGCPPKGISNYYMTVFSGKEKTHIHDLESLGRFSRRLREDLCMRYIPESYSCFMSHADFNNLKKGESHVMTIQMYPKLPLNDLSSPVVQDILSALGPSMAFVKYPAEGTVRTENVCFPSYPDRPLLRKRVCLCRGITTQSNLILSQSASVCILSIKREDFRVQRI